MLVGNKKDLQTDIHTIDALAMEKKLPVTTDDGIVMAGRISAYDYCECSAKLNKGIMDVFFTVLWAMMPRKKDNQMKCILQ